MAVHVSGERIEVVLAQLRAEEPLETDPSQRALLRYEIGVLEESRGDVKAASSEYLAAFDLDPDFREPLESLARLMARTGDDRGLGKMLESLASAATDPADIAAALWDLANYRAEVQGDVASARECLERALATHPDDAAAWLGLEMISVKDGDADLQIRALEARARLSREPTVQATLLIEVASLLGPANDFARASKLLDAAAGLDTRARFRSRLVLESLAIAAGALEAQAVALEAQAELVVAALADETRGDRDGVPRTVRTSAYAVEAWLRASELRRRNADPWGALAAARTAAAQLAGDPLVVRMELAAADAAGDSALALDVAKREAERGATGPLGAALWTRIGLAAEQEGRLSDAARAFGRAIELDPGSAVAEACRLPALLSLTDGASVAQAFEASARGASSDDAIRFWLLAAFAWGVRSNDGKEAQRAIEAAKQAGLEPAYAARVGRALASVVPDWAWYESSTANLLKVEKDARKRAMLSFELGRARVLRGDVAGAETAFLEIASALEPQSWLGRVMMAYACGAERPRARSVARLAELQPDALLGRGLVTVAAWLALREGARERAIDWLAKELEKAPSDVVVALLLSEARRPVDPAGAARALLRAASAVDDEGLAGALWLEGGLLLWRAGERQDAVAAFESATGPAPMAARRVLAWALRAANPDDRELRRRIAELDAEGDEARELGALGIFALDVLEKGRESGAWLSLERLDSLEDGGDFALAAALARLLWGSDDVDPSLLEASLAKIELVGGSALPLVQAERFRRARFVDQDQAKASEAAREWADKQPSFEVALAWLAAAAAAKDRAGEIDARRLVAKNLEGEARIQALSSAAIVAYLDGKTEGIAMFEPSSATSRLLNLELAPPGSAPGRRAAALSQLGDELGGEATLQARRLAAWSELARGANERAKDAFAGLCREDPSDVTSWEGLRAAAELLSDDVALGASLMQLGSLNPDAVRSAELLEQAGLTLIERTAAHDEGEEALVQSLAKDPKRQPAFDGLFKRYRERNFDEGLLGLIAKRIEVTDDTGEITRMYWERARVLRRRGDIRGALAALENIADIEPDHVGALALLGEIRINAARGIVEAGGDATKDFAEAAPILARLAALSSAPDQQRRVSAVAAVDVYDKQLGRPEKAFEILFRLHQDGLTTLALRERLARLAGRTGKWSEAATLLEGLMADRLDSEGRADAARLAMAIHRDKLGDPLQAERAVARLLEEQPDDPDGIEVVLRAPLPSLKPVVMQSARAALESRLAEQPLDPRRIRVLADVAAAGGLIDAQRAALGVLSAVVEPDEALRQTLLRLDTRVAHVPTIALDDRALGMVCDVADEGPFAELFALIAEVVSAALGPSLRTEALSRKDRIESGDPLRVEIARWMGAVGFDDFEVYFGGRRRRAVSGVADELPTLVVGEEIHAPLDAASRAAVAREAFALRRGITAVLHNDDHTIASIVASVSNEVGVPMPPPPFAIYKEVDRAIRKVMNRKLRKEAATLCAQIVASNVDVGPWLAAARRSVDRMALVAAGDVATVLDVIVGSRGTPARAQWERNPRAVGLLRFALSRDYLELRRRLGMGTS